MEYEFIVKFAFCLGFLLAGQVFLILLAVLAVKSLKFLLKPLKGLLKDLEELDFGDDEEDA